MPQTALFNEHLPNITVAATDTTKTVASLHLVAAFSATGTINLRLPQDDTILRSAAEPEAEAPFTQNVSTTVKTM